MFDKKPNEIMQQVQENLKDKLYKNDTWSVDYIRIHMKATKM